MSLTGPSGPLFGESPRSDSVPGSAITPTDERLVDYLLDQPTMGAAPPRECLSDSEIEVWLGSDQANLVRLESLAVSIVALLDQEQPAGRSLASQTDSTCASVTPATLADATVGVVHKRRSFLMVSWLIAAVLLVAIGSYFGTRDRDSLNPTASDLSGELALAWAEQAAVASPSSPFASGLLDESWDAGWREWESGASIEVAEDSFDVAVADGSPAFADGGESPPDWLVLAVAQLSRYPGADERNEEPER